MLSSSYYQSKYVKTRVFNWSLIEIYSFVSFPQQFNLMKMVATVQELKSFVSQLLENSYRIELWDLANSLATLLLSCSTFQHPCWKCEILFFSVNKLIISLASKNSNCMTDNGLSYEKCFEFVQKPKENPQGQLISKAANAYLATTKIPERVMVSEWEFAAQHQHMRRNHITYPTHRLPGGWNRYIQYHTAWKRKFWVFFFSCFYYPTLILGSILKHLSYHLSVFTLILICKMVLHWQEARNII